MKARRGASLIELLVVMAMISTILLMTGPLFHRLFLADQLSARAALIEITTARLSVQFRQDVHASQTATRMVDAASGQPSLELRSESSPLIVYVSEAGQLRRSVMGDEGPTSGETYRLPGCRVEFLAPENAMADDKAPVGNRDLVTLIIERPHSPLSRSNAPTRSRALTLDAEIGRDRRLTAHVVPPAAKVPEETK